MNICVAGWYFHGPFLKVIEDSKHPAFIVAHRDFTGKTTLPGRTVLNTGLEFGCYDWYLKNEWKEGSVFFCHDDNEISEAALDEIALIPFDQCFLFASEEECKANGRVHGRAFFCSSRFLSRLKADGGFWYDEGNHGDIAPTASDTPNYHNSGILTFRAYLDSVSKDMTVAQIGIVPNLKCGYRGRI
jgi:hypothetical protein